MTTATIDIGNSNIKVDYWSDQGVVDRCHCDGSVEEFNKEIREIPVEVSIVSTVRNDSEELIKLIEKKTGCRVVNFNESEIRSHYNINQYKGHLGPDRMAAVLGADVIEPEKSKLVVDLGTAMTIDIADEKGNFIGGNISIGLLSRLKALSEATSKLPMIKNLESSAEFGDDTATAMECGAINGVVGEIIYSYEIAHQKYGVEICIITGGDAPMISERLKDSFRVVYDPYLVGRGLNYHLRTNYL